MKNESDNGYESFLRLVDKMTEEDRALLHSAMTCGDIGVQSELAKKYDFICIPNINNQKLDDEFVDSLLDCDSDKALSKRDVINKIINQGLKSAQFEVDSYDSISDLVKHDTHIKNSQNINGFLEISADKNIVTLIQAYILLRGAGCNYVSDKIFSLCNEYMSNIFLSEFDEKLQRKITISNERSKAGKGNTSKYKESALKIAKDTWDVYPNATQEGMTDELFHYFRGKRTDNPAVSTIRAWLSASKMNPQNDIKNRKFNLIIK
ncbi:hypothetical protein [Morganella morganii]|uniref:hypothetical protein n=1 Tax=Morganella morganii TaxID=582 RepID=UPI0005094FCB|nr:hypothetical protein [Morganella morganii]